MTTAVDLPTPMPRDHAAPARAKSSHASSRSDFAQALSAAETTEAAATAPMQQKPAGRLDPPGNERTRDDETDTGEAVSDEDAQEDSGTGAAVIVPFFHRLQQHVQKLSLAGSEDSADLSAGSIKAATDDAESLTEAPAHDAVSDSRKMHDAARARNTEPARSRTAAQARPTPSADLEPPLKTAGRNEGNERLTGPDRTSGKDVADLASAVASVAEPPKPTGTATAQGTPIAAAVSVLQAGGTDPASRQVASGLAADPVWASYFRELPAAPAHQVKSLKIQLNPAELGMVTANLQTSGEVVSVDLEVETLDALANLTADSDTITRTLRAAGLDVDRVTVRLVDQSATPDRADSQPQRGAAGETGQGSNREGDGSPNGRSGNDRSPRGIADDSPFRATTAGRYI